MMIAAALLLLTSPLPAVPTSVGTPVEYRDRVEIPFTVGSTESPVTYYGDDYVLTIPERLFAWGDIDEMSVIVESDGARYIGSEYDHTGWSGYPARWCYSWTGPGWPDPSDIGDPGSSYTSIEVDAAGTDMGEGREYLPIGYTQKTGGGNPLLPFDGTINYKGTSGGDATEDIDGYFATETYDVPPHGADITLTLTGDQLLSAVYDVYTGNTVHFVDEPEAIWTGTFIYWKE